MKKPVLFLFVLVLLALVGGQVKAEMTGATYKINWDSVNTGGGEDLSGASYHMYSTLSEVGPGNSGGATYNLDAGYQQRDPIYFAFDVSTDTCALGTLITGSQMGACAITLTTTTNASDGYVTAVYDESTGLDDGSNNIDDVAADTQIQNNTEAFGISTEDNNADVAEFTSNGGDITGVVCASEISGPLANFDPLSSTAISIVETATAVTAEATDVCMAAAAGVTTAASEYDDEVTFVSTGYF